MHKKNLIKTARNIATGKSIASLKSYVCIHHPIAWQLRPGIPRIEIKCILCGFPRTGTHWVRNVVEKSTNRKTHNLYSQLPESADKTVYLLKVHARNRLVAKMKMHLKLPPFEFENRYICTYRDPRDAIISLYEMYKHVKGMENLSIENFVKLYDPLGQYRWEIESWVLPSKSDILLVKFEDLKTNPKLWFKKILDYIDLDAKVLNEQIEERVATADSSARPRGEARGWQNAPPQYEPLIETINNELSDIISRLDYD